MHKAVIGKSSKDSNPTRVVIPFYKQKNNYAILDKGGKSRCMENFSHKKVLHEHTNKYINNLHVGRGWLGSVTYIQHGSVRHIVKLEDTKEGWILDTILDTDGLFTSKNIDVV